MKRNLVSADKLQIVLLEELYKAWNIRPGPNYFFPAQIIWDEVYKKFGKNIDGPLAEGVFNDLLKKKYIKAIKMNDDGIAVCLTSDGREYLISEKDKSRTRKIALLGAFTGSISLILTIIKIVLDIISR